MASATPAMNVQMNLTPLLEPQASEFGVGLDDDYYAKGAQKVAWKLHQATCKKSLLLLAWFQPKL